MAGNNSDNKKPEEAPLPPRKKLPQALQETLDNEEKMWEVLVDGKCVLPSHLP